MLGETCLHGCPVAQSVSFAFVGCSVFELLHDLAEVSPKCTEDRCYIQYGIANVQFLSIGDDMNWDDRWWHVHTQSMLGETCLHGCPVAQSVSFAFVGCSVFELLHDLAEVSPKCTEDWCYIQYGIANVQFLSIGDDMNLDDRWWHVHTQSMLGETCLHGCPVAQSVSFAFVGCSVFELLHDLAEVSPKCTEDWCYIQYGIANVQFLSIGDDMNLDDRWWHVHTQSMLGETCLHGCPVAQSVSFAFVGCSVFELL